MVNFFKCVHECYETQCQRLVKADPVIKELAFLDPRNRNLSSSTGLVQLATRLPLLQLMKWTV